MTTIPFAAALKLLERAHDIHVPGYSGTQSFSLDTAEDAASFLELSLEDENHEFFFRFLESANQTVKVDGGIMTLVCDDADEDDLPPEIEIKLMMPMVLETPRDDVHRHQCQLESSLNRILEACGDSSNLPVIRDHARAAKESFDWLDNFAVLKLPTAPETPPVVLKALRHVRAHIPDVDRVVFWGDGRWEFMTDNLSSPTFLGLIDISLLEDAANAVGDGYPHAFQLPPAEDEN